jgi:hypothetical protein
MNIRVLLPWWLGCFRLGLCITGSNPGGRTYYTFCHHELVVRSSWDPPVRFVGPTCGTHYQVALSGRLLGSGCQVVLDPPVGPVVRSVAGIRLSGRGTCLPGPLNLPGGPACQIYWTRWWDLVVRSIGGTWMSD